MKQLVLLSFLVMGFAFADAQTIFGKWKTVDSETGKTESIVEIYKKGDKAYAKIVDILDPERRSRKCTECKGANKDKPILGMNILTGLKKDGDEWSGGKILDPKNGKNYKCYIALDGKDKLKIRGYIGFSLLGRTEYWYRAN